jgi:hypothetical protein
LGSLQFLASPQCVQQDPIDDVVYPVVDTVCGMPDHGVEEEVHLWQVIDDSREAGHIMHITEVEQCFEGIPQPTPPQQAGDVLYSVDECRGLRCRCVG